MFSLFRDKTLYREVSELRSQMKEIQENLNINKSQLSTISKKLDELLNRIELSENELNGFKKVCRDISLALKGNYELVKGIIDLSSKF